MYKQPSERDRTNVVKLLLLRVLMTVEAYSATCRLPGEHPRISEQASTSLDVRRGRQNGLET